MMEAQTSIMPAKGLLMLRVAALCLCICILAGCAVPVRRQSTAAATVTPIPVATSTPVASLSPVVAGLPSERDMADWLLTTGEIEYIRLFRVGLHNWGAVVAEDLTETVTQYRSDRNALKGNLWRVHAADTAQRLRDARLWFDPQSPSDRFRPFADAVTKVLATCKDAGDSLSQAVDENNGRKIELALEQTRQSIETLKAIDVLFTALVGPPE